MSIFGWNRDSKSEPEDDSEGLLPVFGCDSSTRKGDIIFVHGLAGHPWSTWHSSNNKNGNDFWLYWLGEDLQKKGIDVGVWTFGYEAARFLIGGNAMPLFDLASNLLEYLKVNSIGNHPLIFVTHSMGGLLVKEAIRTAQDFDDKKAIIKQTKGIVFLSTPHTGAHLASLIDNIRVLVRPNVNVEELKAHDPELRKLNQWYRQNVENLTIETKVFYETQRMNGILVVDEDSANPGIRDIQPIPIPKDHNSIAKPQKNDLVYLSVKDFVIKLLSSDSKLEALSTPSGSQRKRLREAIIDAYRNISDLKMMVREQLGENLNEIAGEGSLNQVVFDLIEWAEAHSQLKQLVEAACDGNPGNQKLQDIRKELFAE